MKKRIILFLLIILLLFIYLNSNFLVKNILDYTETFIKNLFPYTFIVFTLSSLLVDYDLLSILEPKYYITIMSLISGFPSGAKYTAELLEKNFIDKDTSNYLITYTHYPNPLFILGAVSSIITKNLAIKLLFSIYLASFITSRFFKVKSSKKITSSNYNNVNFTKSLSSSINGAFKTLILIYGASIFSIIIALIITHSFNLNGICYSLINGIFDLTKGIFSTVIINNKRIRAILILVFINLASISIHMQVKSILDNTEIKYSNFLKGRIISTLLAVIIFIIITGN